MTAGATHRDSQGNSLTRKHSSFLNTPFIIIYCFYFSALFICLSFRIYSRLFSCCIFVKSLHSTRSTYFQRLNELRALSAAARANRRHHAIHWSYQHWTLNIYSSIQTVGHCFLSFMHFLLDFYQVFVRQTKHTKRTYQSGGFVRV